MSVISSLLGIGLIGATPSDSSQDSGRVRIVPPEGIRVNAPANATVREAQSIMLFLGPTAKPSGVIGFGQGYRDMALSSGELAWMNGSGQGFYGSVSAEVNVTFLLARVFDALSGNDPASAYYIRKENGAIDFDRFDGAVKEYKKAMGMRASSRISNEMLYAVNEDLADGKIDSPAATAAVPALPNNPAGKDLLGRVASTRLSVVCDRLTNESIDATGKYSGILREDALRFMVNRDEGLKISTSPIGKDVDPVRELIDCAHDIVGGIFNKGNDSFYLSWNDKAGLVVNGKINWDGGVVAKEAAEAKFRALGGDKVANLDFETQLISEIKGGVIGYAILAVLSVASGSDQINISAVRAKATEAIKKRYPGATVSATPPVVNRPTPGPTPGPTPLPTPGPTPLPTPGPTPPPSSGRNLTVSGDTATAIINKKTELSITDEQEALYYVEGSFTLTDEQYDKAVQLGIIK